MYAFMIGYLRGTILEKRPNRVVVEAGGVGYDVTVPISTYSALPAVGSQVQLRIHTHLREDALSLYGFLSQEEKSLFERLIEVSGIGPRLAVTVLSGLPTADLIASIRHGQVEQLVRIPGVGKKTAERIVLELRDKLDILGVGPPAAALPPGAFSALDRDVLSALTNLGCTRVAAEAALRKAKEAGAPDEFEPLFRRALELIR
jgi:Holliday junction DNA helicase RuvA